MANRAIAATATSAHPAAVSRMCSLSCCRGRSPGMTLVSIASVGWTGGRVRRRHAITSSSLVGSPRPCIRWAPARATCARLVSLAIAPAVFGSMPRPASCASSLMVSSSPIGWSCSRQSCLCATGRLRGRRRARCCSIICHSGSGPWTGAESRSRAAGSRLMSSARWATALARRGCGARRRSQAHIPPTGARFWARCRGSQGGSSVMPTPGCCRRSRSAGREWSCTSANGICSTPWSACWPKS
jgi:hypothetical protein